MFFCFRNAENAYVRRRGVRQESHSKCLPPLLMYTDALLTGWGAYRLDLTVAGVWSCGEKEFHINVFEMMAVILALNAFLDRLTGESVVLMSDNATNSKEIWNYLRVLDRASTADFLFF